MIGVVDYEAGNIASVSNALEAVGIDFVVTASREKLGECSGVILPGVGAAPGAMASLERGRLTEFLKNPPVPLLGICLGMQILFETSEEGPTRCVGLLPGTVKKFDASTPKVPHMGWNAVDRIAPSPLFAGIRDGDYFYFAHSYYAPVGNRTVAVTSQGVPFASALQSGNVFGVQFHPEKSGPAGLQVLRNFAALCR